MTRKQINDQFVKYTPLLHKLSHQCASRCGRPEEEIYGQACYLFMQATRTFNPERSAHFGPYMHSCVHNRLMDWGIKNDLPPSYVGGYASSALNKDTPVYRTSEWKEVMPEIIDETPTPDEAAVFNDWLSSLKEEVREVAVIILNGPTELLDIVDTATPKAVRGALRHYLRRTKKWSWPKIWDVIRETKAAVAALAIK